MDVAHALALGVVEGLTEFLPVSSTGHLILMSRLFGEMGDAEKALDIVIQAGAVLAAVVYYRARLWGLLRGLWLGERASGHLAACLAIAFVPVVPAGLLLNRVIKERLFGPGPVAGALVAGGVLMLALELWQRPSRHREASTAPAVEAARVRSELDALPLWKAAVIGIAQCLSLWPGASRAMVTIVAGRLTGLSTSAAAEFSFLLAIPTLGAATAYDLVKHGHDVVAAPGGVTSLTIGLGTSFVVAWLVIAAFLRYLGRLGLGPFAMYRIALGLLVLLAV